MKLENHIIDKIESEIFLTEKSANLQNILKRSSVLSSRRVSRQIYDTVYSEINSEYDKMRKVVMKCKTFDKRDSRKNCRKEAIKTLILRIEKLKTICEKSLYHKAKCIRKCDSVIKYLTRISSY